MKILVVIDVQNDFVDGKLGTQEAINMIPKLKEKIKNFDGEIIPSATISIHSGTASISRDLRVEPQHSMRKYDHSIKYIKGFESRTRSEEHTSELQSQIHLVCRLLLEKKN